MLCEPRCTLLFKAGIFLLVDLRRFFIQKSSENDQTTNSLYLILKCFVIFIKICAGHSLLTVSLSKIPRQKLKKHFFFNETNNIKSPWIKLIKKLILEIIFFLYFPEIYSKRVSCKPNMYVS